MFSLRKSRLELRSLLNPRLSEMKRLKSKYVISNDDMSLKLTAFNTLRSLRGFDSRLDDQVYSHKFSETTIF